MGVIKYQIDAKLIPIQNSGSNWALTRSILERRVQKLQSLVIRALWSLIVTIMTLDVHCRRGYEYQFWDTKPLFGLHMQTLIATTAFLFSSNKDINVTLRATTFVENIKRGWKSNITGTCLMNSCNASFCLCRDKKKLKFIHLFQASTENA